MSRLGHSRPGRTSTKFGHARYAAESGSKFMAVPTLTEDSRIIRRYERSGLRSEAWRCLRLTLSGIPISADRRDHVQGLRQEGNLACHYFLGTMGLRVERTVARETFLLGVLPTATEASASAMARNIYRDGAADSTIVSVLTGAITISVGVAVAFLVQSQLLRFRCNS
jgi:hypothetical protein